MAVAKAFSFSTGLRGPLFAFLTVTGVNGVRCDLQVRVIVDGARDQLLFSETTISDEQLDDE
jgi:hypothetical protein